MTIIFERLALLMMAIAIGVNFYFDNKGFDRDVKANETMTDWYMGATIRIIHTEEGIDSLKKVNVKLAKATMYIDSIQATQKTKTDRAERRGKFVGGLLRGLIPGI
jgi:hypothetical protein